MQQYIDVIVGRDGKSRVEVHGVKGTACRDLTAQLEKAMGRLEESHPTAEAYETEDQRIKLEHRR